jgi:hypothetical protein
MPRSKNSRKQKNRVYRPVNPPNPFSRRLSNTYFRHMEMVGRKLLRLAGVDISFLDRMTKQQLRALLNVPCEKPRVIIKKGARVPQAYLRYIRSSLYAAMETTCVYNNADIGLTLADMLSYGFAFIGGLHLYPHRREIVLGEVEAVSAAFDTIGQSNLHQLVGNQVTTLLTTLLMHLSQVQFRLYGFLGSMDIQPSGLVGMTIALTSAVPECISFKHFGLRRKAYRFCMGPIQMPEMYPAKIPYSLIFPLCGEKNDRKLSVYIQQHAILRVKERLRILSPTERTILLYNSLMISPKIIKGPDDQPLFTAHINEGEILGYFTFVIQGNKLFVLTFLPITSAMTPEGKRLQKMIHLSKRDIAYLGMDTLGFIFDIDFDQIPLLKEALIASGIYRARDYFKGPPPRSLQVIEKQTAFVKKYLEEHPANNPDEPEPPDDEDMGQ